MILYDSSLLVLDRDRLGLEVAHRDQRVQVRVQGPVAHLERGFESPGTSRRPARGPRAPGAAAGGGVRRRGRSARATPRAMRAGRRPVRCTASRPASRARSRGGAGEVGERSPIGRTSTRGTPSSRRGRVAGTRPGHAVAGTVAAEPRRRRPGPAVGRRRSVPGRGCGRGPTRAGRAVRPGRRARAFRARPAAR